MYDLYWQSTRLIKGACVSQNTAADANKFEQELKIARESRTKENIGSGKEAPADNGPGDVALFELLSGGSAYNSVLVAEYAQKTGHSEAAGSAAVDAHKLREKLQWEVFEQLELNDLQTPEYVNSGSLVGDASGDMHWTIDLSDLINRKICVNICRQANGRWTAALSTTTGQDVDPVLELLREQLADLIHSKESLHGPVSGVEIS